MQTLLKIILFIFLSFNLTYANEIIASHYQLALILGDNVDYIIPKDQDPHDYNLKPSDLLKIKNSKHFVTFGEYANISPKNTLNLGFDIHSIYNIPKILEILDVIKNKLPEYYNDDQRKNLYKLHISNLKYFKDKNLAYISTHDGIKEFADAYNIKSYGSIISDHDHHAKPSDVHRIKKAVIENKVNCIIYQDLEELDQARDIIDISKLNQVQIKYEKTDGINLKDFSELIDYVSKKFKECQ